MSGLLEGIRVIECSQAIQGGAVGAMLGDLGADVVKLEDRRGDVLRNWGSVMGVSMQLPGSKNVAFESVNRNKRSIAADLKTDDGRRILSDLVEGADVLITNFRPPARQRLGLDYKSLSELNPRVIVGVATAYGSRGPSANEGGYDNVAFARSGMMHLVGDDEDSPRYMSPGAADMVGATVLVLGVLGALYSREQTGRGQEVESSLLGSLLHILTLPLATHLLAGRSPKRPSRRRLFNPLIGWYECSDGEWVMLSINQPQEAWPSFCESLGFDAAIEHDPRFTSTRSRAENCEALVELIEAAMHNKTRQEWLSDFRRRDLISSPVNRVEDIPNDEQIQANDYIVEVPHPELQAMQALAFPVSFSETPARISTAAPELGQHTEEILLELGYDWERIAEFQDMGVI